MNIKVPTLRSSLLHTAIATALIHSVAPAASLYWDTNGATAGSGNGSGNWDADSNWSTSAAGDAATTAWTNGESAVFSAGSDGANFTATVTGTVTTPSIVVEEAGNTVTIAGGTINIGGGSIDTSLLGPTTNRNVAISSVLAGSGGLTIAANGNTSDNGGSSNSELDLTGVNTFTGDLTITSGIVGWNADTAFGDAANGLIFDGGGLVDTNRGLTLSRDISITGNGGFIRTYGSVSTIVTGTISGAGSLTKTDGGPLVIESDNSATYTGKLRIGGGQLKVAEDSALGAVPAAPVADAITLANGARFANADTIGGNDLTLPANRGVVVESGNAGFNASASFILTVDSPITGAGNFTKGGNGEMVLNGAASHTGETRVEGGFFQINSTIAGTTHFRVYGTSEVAINSGAEINADRFVTSDGNGAKSTITHTGGTLNVTGTSNIKTSLRSFNIGHWGAGSASSVYNLSGGELNALGAELGLGWDSTNVTFNQTGGTANLLGIDLANGRSNPATYNLEGGVLNLGSSGITTNGAKTINLGGATLGALAPWSSGQSMALTGINGDLSVEAGDHAIGLSGVLSGPGGIVVESGLLSLGGANTYTGTTTVNDGAQLRVSGADASPVVVNTGGMISGNSVSAIVPSSMPSLDLKDGTTSSFRLGYDTATIADTLGTTDTDGFSITGSHSIDIVPTIPLFVGDQFTLFDYEGSIQGAGFAGLSLGSSSNPHISYTLIDDAATTSVILEVTAADSLLWTGSASGVWDTNGATNWELSGGGTASKFFPLDAVSFEDDATNTNITVSGTVEVASLSFDNSFDTFTFSGGAIGGPTGIDKNGDGTVIFNNQNTFTGKTLIGGGTLVIGSEEALGASPLGLVANQLTLGAGTLSVSGTMAIDDATRGIALSSPDAVIDVPAASTLTISSPLSGSGPFTKTGEGSLVSSGGSWTGGVNVAEGTLRMNSKSGVVDYTVQPGAVLELGYTSTGNYNSGAVVHGSGLASPSGLYLKAGTAITFQRSGGLRLSTAPTTVRTYESGQSTLNGFDIGGAHLSVDAAASGSVIDSSVNFNTGGYGYRMNVAAGANTTTGDVIFNGVLGGSGSVNKGTIPVNYQKYGAGSVVLNGTSTFDDGIWIRQGSVILGGDNVMAASVGAVFGDGAGVSGTLVMNGFSQTFSDISNFNGNIDSRILGGAAATSTLTVNVNAAGRTFSGQLGGTGNEGNLALVKTGTGDLTLAGVLAYTGPTTVTEGVLGLATASLDDNSTVSIGAAGKLDLAHGASDVVASLILDGGTPITSGTYGATGSGAANIDDVHFSGTGMLNVGGVADPYADFESSNGIAGAGAGTDSDGDGIENGIEFVIGGDPSGPNSDSNALLPTATSDATYLNFVFRRTAASASANPYVQYGSDLSGWATAAHGTDEVIISVEMDGFEAGVDRVTVQIPRALGAGGLLFARLRVDIP
ncbi:beta strand repeat-containing protein [Luteolibacter marinus]|uniref:beta strand repeat-containing protein n=1 Tax=Luteolibacter marinus TaxID=2776705 RepID=UPI00186732A4|nr:autotransporter-associated beta strand repeat-containing protein [Luteolibacter marinus]